jgi:hypothetical protein
VLLRVLCCLPQQPTNRSNAVQTSSQKKLQQRASSSQLQADSAALAQQLGRLPGSMNGSSAPSAAGGQQGLQLSSQLKRNDSMSEQYYFLRPASEHAAAVQQLRGGGFTMQFLEPPNSQMPSGQLTHPAVNTQASTRRMSASALAGEKSAALCSIPGNSSLLRPGQAPALNTIGVSWVGKCCSG